jgi:hypothetical protein
MVHASGKKSQIQVEALRVLSGSRFDGRARKYPADQNWLRG